MRLDDISILDVIEEVKSAVSEPVAVFDHAGRLLGCTHPELRETASEAMTKFFSRGEQEAPATAPQMTIASRRSGDSFDFQIILFAEPPADRKLAFIKTLIDVTLENRELKNRLESDFSDRIYFINQLTTSEEKDEETLAALAMQLKYNPAVARCALLFQIRRGSAPIEYQEGRSIKDYFGRVLERESKLGEEDIFGFVQADRFVIFKTVDSVDAHKNESTISTFIQSLIRAAETTYGLHILAGVGTPYEKLSSLRNSFAEAQFVLSNFYLNRQGPIIFVHRFVFEYLSSLIPRDYMEDKFSPYARKLAGNPAIHETLTELSLNDFSLIQTAGALAIHRNTMLQRYGKLKKTLAIDPLRSDRDRMQLRQFVLFRNQKTILHAGIIIQEGSTLHAGYEKFAESIAEMSGGSMALTIHTISHSGNNRHLMEILKSGSIDIAVCDFQSLNLYTEGHMSVLELPFLFDSTEEAFRLLDGPIGQALYDCLEPTGLIGLRFWSMGWRYISSRNRLITEPADLVGSRIRIMHKDIVEAYFKSIGAIPIKMNYSDVSAALELGLVDCQENPYSNFIGMKFYEHQNIVNEIPLTLDVVALLTTQTTWRKLTDRQREIVVDASKKATLLQRAEMKRINETCRRELRDQYGVVINTIDAKSVKHWRQSAKPVYESFLHQDLLKKIIETKKSYHAERKG